MHTLRGTTDPPVTQGAVIVRFFGSGITESLPQTTELGPGGSFTVQAVTPATPGIYHWFASRDASGAGSASIDSPVTADQPPCAPDTAPDVAAPAGR